MSLMQPRMHIFPQRLYETQSRPREQPNYEKQIKNYVYQLKDVIGIGEFSKVYSGRDIITEEKVAIKVVEINKITQQIFMTLLNNEITILPTLKHKNVLQLLNIYRTQNNMYLITEFCDQGDLASALQSSKTLGERKVVKVMKHLVKGLTYLQTEHQIIHRDIKPANILISDGIPKFADFGFALTKQMSESQQDSLQGFSVGTPLYMAPETILKNHYTFKTDVFALGCVFYEMLFGHVPFFSTKHSELINKIKQFEKDRIIPFPQESKISFQAKNLLMRMLDFDPCKRISVQELAQNPYLCDPRVLINLQIDTPKLKLTPNNSQTFLTPSPIQFQKKHEPLRQINSKSRAAKSLADRPENEQENSTRMHTNVENIQTVQEPQAVSDRNYPNFKTTSFNKFEKSGGQERSNPNNQSEKEIAIQLCKMVDQTISELIQDKFFVNLQIYIDNFESSDYIQLDQLSEKLHYLGLKFQYIISSKYINDETQSRIREKLMEKKISSQARNDQIFDQVTVLSRYYEKSFFETFELYLNLTITAFEKYLDDDATTLSVKRFKDTIKLHERLLEFLNFFNDFTEFCKL